MNERGTCNSTQLQARDSQADSGSRGPDNPAPGWKRIIDPDFLYTWATLLVIPAYAITAELRSHIFVLYALLFCLKVWKSGYVRCGLEYCTAIAILGLAASWIGTWDAEVLKRVLQVGRIVCMPILMCQYQPIRKLENALALIFSGLAVYGMARMLFAPLVTGYAQDRPYCYSNFFMHSSIIAFSGFLFFLVTFVRKKGWGWKLFSAGNVLMFASLVAMQRVRASYLALLALVPIILLLEFRKQALLSMACLLLCCAAAVGGLYVFKPAIVHAAAAHAASMADMHNGSNRGRLVFWRKAVDVFRENPVNGIGYWRFNRDHVDLNNPEFEWAFWHAHSEFFSMLAETGLVGIIAWWAFKLKLLWTFFRRRAEWAGAFALYLLLAFEIHNVFESYLYERIAYIYVFLLLGMGLNQVIRKDAAGAALECEK